MNKRLALALAAAFAATVPSAYAQYDRSDRYDRYESRDYRFRDRDRRDDTARVIESRRIYANNDGRQECYNPRTGQFEELRNNETRVGKGAAIGAVTGGVLGHQVDQGGGTAAGAVIGGLLGHHLERRHDRDEQTDLDRSRCRVVGSAYNDAPAYEVRYEFQGREYTTYLDHEPGARLRVGRDLHPDGSPINERPVDRAYSGG